MNKPMVSILTITYNQERYIEQCIESVLAQTFTDWQMLIVDDGSDDGTCDKVKSYKDDRIVLICAPHRGMEKLKESYGLALEQAYGSLISILDGDDFWPPNKLAIEVPVFSKPDVVMAFGGADIYNDKGEYVQTAKLPDFAKGLVEGNVLIRKILGCGYFIHSVTTMLRRDAIDRIGGFVQPQCLPLVDIPTWLNILRGARCVGISEVLGCYRVHNASVCRTRSGEIIRGHMLYNEIFLDANWACINLSERKYHKFRRKILAYNNHRLGALFANEKNWSKARHHFLFALHNGNFIRKVKAIGRLELLFIQSIYRKIRM